MDLTSLRKQRRELAHRRRRIIYNNDGCDTWAPCPDDHPSAAEFLGRRTTGLELTQVHTISYNAVNSWDFGTGRHNSRVCDVLIDGKTLVAPEGENHPRLLVEGKDCVGHVLDFCRKHDIEMWVSVRTNPIGSMWYVGFRAPFKADHPERWIGCPPELGGGFEEKMFLLSEAALEHPDRWTAIGSSGAYYCADYGHPDVRQRLLAQVREVCENYDLDGLEFDMLRTPIGFKATAAGQPDVGQAARDQFTEMMREIRTTTEQIGLDRGRPIVIATRIPDDPDYAAAIGLETVRWLQEQLIDIVIAGEADRLRPWQETVALCRQYDVPVYAAVTEHGQSEAHHRGKAHAAWAAGVDGIYTYNEFDPHCPLFNELGNADRLAQTDRIIPVMNANVSRLMDHLRRLPQIDRFLARQPRLPLGLPAGQAQPFEFEAVAVDERTPHVQMELLLRNLEAGDVIDFVLNGSELDLAGAQRDTPRPGWIVIRVNRTLIQAGYNRLEIAVRTRDPAATDQLALADLMLRITAKPYDYRNDPSPPIASRPSPVTGALVITATDVQLPPGRVTAQRQWLLDELNGARPRVMSARAVMEHSANPDLPAQARFHVRTGMARQLNCPPDPAEQPLPGWHSLAVLFDADRMGADFQKQLAGVLAERVDRAMRRFAGPVVGTQSLAAIAVCAEVEQDLVRVADRFTDDAIPGSLPRPIRFLWAWDDGNLIARTFALILCDDTGCNAGESTVKDVPVRLGFMARRSTGEAGRTDDR